MDHGTKYGSKAQHHNYESYLPINDIEHTKIKAYLSQAHDICERFHKTILQVFYQVAFLKKYKI